MKRSVLLAGVATVSLVCAVPAIAQMPQSGQQEKGTQMKSGPGSATGGENRAESQKGEAQEKGSKATSQNEPKDKATKGTAEKGMEPKDKATKGTAEKGMEPKDKATKGTAEKGMEPKDKATKGASSESRVQLSQDQRTNVHQTILKERNVNRATSVNFSINVGTRVPRSVRLAALPASVVTIVPEYRSYRYFVANDDICIVDPNTYEIVEVVSVSGQTAARGGPSSTSARLVLTDEEKALVLREIDMSNSSTLALGALSEGADVPRDARVEPFSEVIVERVPKLRGHKFFTAENRVVVTDEPGSKVQLVIEDRR